MFNIILDPYPDNYNGHLIRTDFRIGIEIILALEDENLADCEKWATALMLLFGESIPRERETAINGLRWFLSGGVTQEERQDGIAEEENDDQEEKSFDYDYDASRLHSAFLRAYNIDLNKVRLHWFEFRGLMQDLGECALSTVIEYRTKNLNDCINSKQRNEYAKLKKKYSLPRKLTDEDREKMDEFLRAMSLSQKTGI